MNINVTKTQVSITNDYILNDKEYNVNKCYFTFSEEYTSQLVKKAIFVQGTATIEEPIINNECLIPSEVLNRGTFELRVYAYEVEDEELILRYSPTPTLVYVRAGSYIEGAESPEVITPSQFEQYMQALNDGLNEVANVDIDAEQLTNGTKITITDRTGIEKIVYVYDGVDGVDGKDATINGVNTLSIVAGQNIGLNQVGDTLTINNTYDDTQIVNDITNLQSGLSGEILNRENADNNLQSQIDAITVSSDVIDVVGTYQELLDYDTQHVKANDIIKVLQDSTHNQALSYYRWVIVNHIGSWVYVGSEGPFYTKSETDELLNAKQNEITSSNKLNADLVNDSTSTNKFITQSQANQIVTNQNNITNLQTNKQDKLTFDETPIENSTNPVTSGGIYTSQEEQNELIDYISLYANALPKVTGTGTEVTLNDTANCPMPMSLKPSATSQDTTNGYQKLNQQNIRVTSGVGAKSVDSEGYLTAKDTTSDSRGWGYAGRDYQLTLPAGTYTLLVETIVSSTSGGVGIYYSDNTKILEEFANSGFIQNVGNHTAEFTLTEEATIGIMSKLYTSKVRFSILSSGTTYEPYTGGMPSPNPEYPTDIHTVSGNNTIEVFSKNLFNINTITENTYITETGTTGTSTATNLSDYILISPSSNYVLSFDYTTLANTGYRSFCFYDENKTFISGSAYNPSGKIRTMTSPNNAKYIRFAYDKNCFNIQFESGNTPTAYENERQTLPLNLGTIELCKIGTYEDYFYKDNDKWYLHKEIKKIIYNGSENWIKGGADQHTENTNLFYYNTSEKKNGASNLICDLFPVTNIIGSSHDYIGICGQSNNKYIYIRINQQLNTGEFKTWLSNNHTTVYYVLNDATNTEITNATLISQLETIYNKAISYQDQTNITQVNNDLPFVITASAIYDLRNLLN